MAAPDPRGALVWSPFADEASALAAARTLVAEGLARCGNVVPGLTSVFAWQGTIDTAREAGLLLKTRADRLDALIARLETIHPYDTPAVFGWVCDASGQGTLEWLAGPS
ncbi:divalent-cation tolerance protein CutA [Novosphingobium sp. 1949]|uniref:Divalent-cation tolerance protein CutA n=1 Tax=Novosphingobium organovorum TaxID=2930092 RepID=A0ABT0BAZ4_9SPHN|nr:divalent-cation tolerance protein CutA [Novosphingobium organovorum]MCJ2182241.1 divalent-cation tolerance protein CutA [Novosphingobium organovorum]